MTLRVRQAPPEHYPWIAERATLNLGSEFRAIEAVDEKGRIHAMVGYDSWCPGSVSMHVAIENPVAIRRMARTAFALPFLSFGLPLVKANILGDNPKSLRFARAMGFKEVAVLEDWWSPGVAIHLLEMRRENCRWIEVDPLRKAG